MQMWPHAASGYALIASDKAAASSPYSTVTTPGVNTTGANLIVLGVTTYRGAGVTSTPTDSKGNSYVLVANYTDGAGGAQLAIFYCYAPTVGASHTISYPTVASSFPTIIMKAYSGASSSPLDQFTGFGNTGYTGASTIQPGSVTPSTNGQLVFTCISAWLATSSPTINSGFTTPIFQQSNAAQTYSTAASDLFQSIAAAINGTWSFNPNSGSGSGVTA